MTRDEWPNYICCVLTVREELIKSIARWCRSCVDYVQAPAVARRGAGQPQQGGGDRGGTRFFNQDPSVLQFVMENPSDRVTYGDLRLIRAEFEEMVELSMEAGTIKRRAPFENYVDASFVRNIKPVAIPL
jgi:NitT/TauT family transport system substrate-binding protein